MSDSVRPHRRQPTRLPRPWASPGKNAGVGCHLLLQCMKVKSESEVAQSCLTLSDPVDCSLPGSSTHGIFQARLLGWSAIVFSRYQYTSSQNLVLLISTFSALILATGCSFSSLLPSPVLFVGGVCCRGHGLALGSMDLSRETLLCGSGQVLYSQANQGDPVTASPPHMSPWRL